MVNQTEVAKLAGVSFITVSRVINKKGNVKEETRERVLEAIKTLGYYPSSLGRGLSSNKVQTIGMRLKGDISSDFLSDLLSGVEVMCKKNDYNLLLSFNDDESELKSFFERKVDGIILLLSNLTKEDIALIEKHKIPTVILFDKIDSDDIISVCFDDYKAGYLATEYFIKSGHKRIMHITGSDINICSKERQKGYLQAMSDNNFEHSLMSSNFSYESGCIAANEIVNMEEMPTAIFCVGDLVAFGVMDVLRREGIKVPEDISIIGFDSGNATSQTYCPLTSIYNPVKEIGRIGTEALLNKINGVKTEKSINNFEVKLAIKKSVKIIK